MDARLEGPVGGITLNALIPGIADPEGAIGLEGEKSGDTHVVGIGRVEIECCYCSPPGQWHTRPPARAASRTGPLPVPGLYPFTCWLAAAVGDQHLAVIRRDGDGQRGDETAMVSDGVAAIVPLPLTV